VNWLPRFDFGLLFSFDVAQGGLGFATLACGVVILGVLLDRRAHRP